MSVRKDFNKQRLRNSESLRTGTKPKLVTNTSSSSKDGRKTEMHRSESLGRQNNSNNQRSRRSVSIDRGLRKNQELQNNAIRNAAKETGTASYSKLSSQSPVRKISIQSPKQKQASSSYHKVSEGIANTNSSKPDVSEKKVKPSKQSVGSKKSEINKKISKSSGKASSSKPSSDKKRETHPQAGKTVELNSVSSDNVLEPDENLSRPRTSTIKKSFSLDKGQAINGKVPSSELLHTEDRKPREGSYVSSASDEGAFSYEEDFEEYESDFEDNDSDSVEEYHSSQSGHSELNYENEEQTSGMHMPSFSGIVQPTIVKQQVSKPPKIVEKTTRTEFLKMSARSSTFLIEESTAPPSSLRGSSSFIDFAAAVQEQEKKRQCNKVLKRMHELLELVRLDEMSYEIFEMPPMKYELFIKSFGKLNSKQESIQTENSDEQEIQTQEIEMFDKWTQNPPFDNFGVGGDGCFGCDKYGNNFTSHFKTHAEKLQKYLQNVSPVVLAVLSEDHPHATTIYSVEESSVGFSQGSFKFLPVPVCDGVPVIFVSCSGGPVVYMLSIHSKFSEAMMGEEKGVMCIWNTFNHSKPEHMLTSNSQPSCACFGPDGSDVLIAGMVDGSLMLWDLTELAIFHQTYLYENHEVPLRSPTFNTAANTDVCHKSCVIAVQVFQQSRRHSDSLKNIRLQKNDFSERCNVLSLEEMGVLNIWTIVECSGVNLNDDMSDMGLAPVGRMKLVWNSSVSLKSFSFLPENLRDNMQTFDLKMFPAVTSHVLVATDFDQVLHLNQSGHTMNPRNYDCMSGFPTELRCITCSPHNDGYFLVGGSNGNVVLFKIQRSNPLKTVFQAAKGESVVCLQWSCTHPSSFYVLGSLSSLHMWNLSKDSLNPQYSYTFSEPKIVWFSIYGFRERKCKSKDDTPSQMALAKANGEIEVHSLHWKFDEISEKDYMEELEMIHSL